MMNHNVGNIKASPEQDHCYFTTWESMATEAARQEQANSRPGAPCMIIAEHDGRARVQYGPDHPTARFRSYETLADGCEDYLNLLRAKRAYAPAWAAAMTGDPYAFVHRLKQAGYFTAGEEQYRSSIVSLFHEYNRSVPPPVPPRSAP